MSRTRIPPRVAVIGAGVLAAAVLAAGAVAWRAMRSDATGPAVPEQSTVEPTTAAPDGGPEFPVDGTYRLKVGNSGQCLGVGPERGNEQRTVLVQHPC